MSIEDAPAIAEPDEPICEVVITAPDSQWLAEVTRQLVELRLVAGSHQIESVRSIYRWKGEVHDVREARVTLRTRLSHFESIRVLVVTEHPYATPSIVAVPIVAAAPAYSAWVLESTRPSA
jgi:periplasmic divalent cation tolerance protein